MRVEVAVGLLALEVGERCVVRAGTSHHDVVDQRRRRSSKNQAERGRVGGVEGRALRGA